VLAAVRAGLPAKGVMLPPQSEAVRPMPGDGWESRVDGAPAYWARHADGTLAVFALDVAGAAAISTDTMRRRLFTYWRAPS